MGMEGKTRSIFGHIATFDTIFRYIETFNAISNTDRNSNIALKYRKTSIGIVIRTRDGPKKCAFSYFYTPYLALTTFIPRISTAALPQ